MDWASRNSRFIKSYCIGSGLDEYRIFFRYHTNTGGFVIQKGSSAKTTTRLPLGNPLFDYAIGLEVLIIDGLGAAETELLYVTVRN